MNNRLAEVNHPSANLEHAANAAQCASANNTRYGCSGNNFCFPSREILAMVNTAELKATFALS